MFTIVIQKRFGIVCLLIPIYRNIVKVVEVLEQICMGSIFKVLLTSLK